MCYEKIALPARYFYYNFSRVHEMYKPMPMKVTAPPQGSIANYILVRRCSQTVSTFSFVLDELCYVLPLEKFNLVVCNPC